MSYIFDNINNIDNIDNIYNIKWGWGGAENLVNWPN